MLPDVAIVAIGRNEGERLRLCLKSAVSQALTVIYVDSGSTDDSKVIAQGAKEHFALEKGVEKYLEVYRKVYE